jgi:hypothetical protein
MVTRDGFARVLDFGLARTEIDESASTLAGPEAEDSAASDSASGESSRVLTKLAGGACVLLEEEGKEDA